MSDTEILLCENCGGKTESFTEGSCCGTRCRVCSWSVVATNITPIRGDMRMYEVFLNKADYKNQLHLKAFAQILNENLVSARKKLSENSSPEVFRGLAEDVAEVLKILREAGIEYKTIPEFPW